MEFCPKCGSRLEPKKSKSGKDATLVLACPKCGYKKPEADKKIEAGGAKSYPAFSSTVCGCYRQRGAEAEHVAYCAD